MKMSNQSKGVPTRMRATCNNCGYIYEGGTVTVWLKHDRDEGKILNEPKDGVSFLCFKGCDKVHDMDVEVLKRRDTNE